MFKRLILIFMLGSIPTSVAAQSDFVLPACDLTVEKTLYWLALEQEVTIRAEIKGETNTLPRGNSYLIFADGTEVHLGEGGKYIDDFTADDIPQCENHMELLLGPIVGSINPSEIDKLYAYMPHSMGQMDKVLSIAENCDIDNKDRLFRQLECRDIKDMADNFLEYSEILPEDYNRLVAQDAPLIDVPYSTYGTDSFVIDIETKELYSIGYSGC